jgi:hypothetical protein
MIAAIIQFVLWLLCLALMIAVLGGSGVVVAILYGDHSPFWEGDIDDDQGFNPPRLRMLRGDR